MTTGDNAALRARVDGQDESLRAIADTVLDVKETVEEHTEILTRHGVRLDRIEATLGRHETRLDGIDGRLAEHSTTLAEHGEMLRELLRRIPPPAA